MPIQDRTNYFIMATFILCVFFLLTTNMGLWSLSKQIDRRANEHDKINQEIVEIKTVVYKNRELLTFRNRVIGSNEISKLE